MRASRIAGSGDVESPSPVPTPPKRPGGSMDKDAAKPQSDNAMRNDLDHPKNANTSLSKILFVIDATSAKTLVNIRRAVGRWHGA
jgi:hypothetical protein